MPDSPLMDVEALSPTGKTRAQKCLRHKNKRACRSHFKLPGHIGIVSGSTILTVGFGLFDVKWIIEEVVHVVAGGKHETEIEMRIVLSY